MSREASFKLSVDGIEVGANNGKFIIEFVTEINDVLNQIDIDDAIDFYGEDRLLDIICIDRVKDYFNLTE